MLEKIINELRPNSPELVDEIDEKETKLNTTNAQIVFKNTSYIKVVTAADTARSNRANIMLIDEFRMVRKDVIDTVLRKFLSNPRQPKYLDKPEYKHLQERNKVLYLSSAFYKDHWSFLRTKDSCRFMLDDKRSDFVCGLPYQLPLQEGLMMKEDILEQMDETDFSEIKWAMEMEALFWGDSNDTFFGFETVSKNRKLVFPMLPDKVASRFPGQGSQKLRITPKAIGEKRLISVDVALMASKRHRNDASSIFINQLLPTKAQRYSNNIIYTESIEGSHTEDLAVRVRRLYEEYQCDYIVLDTRGLGLGVYDAMARDLTDPETGEIYPAVSCCNNPELADRCAVKDAEKIVWAILGNAKFNSDCALLLREAFRSGKIRLLINEYDAEEAMAELKGFGALSPSDKIHLMMPYVHTTLLVDELIKLRHEDSGGLIKIQEKSGMRKDRYSSLSYNYWVACSLENKLRDRSNSTFNSGTNNFMFRAPKIKKDKGRW